MSSTFKVQSPKFKKQTLFFALCFVFFAFCYGCSIPNLEKPDCTDARNAMREFYSFHYSNDMKFNQENLKQRQKFLTPELFQMLSQKPDNPIDYFTGSDEPPKSFRIGKCEIIEPDRKTSLEVVFFWRNNTIEESRQKEVQVEAEKENNEWLVNKVDVK